MDDAEKLERKRALSRERVRRYRERHPERCKEIDRAKSKRYAEKNPEKVKASNAALRDRRRAEIVPNLAAAIKEKAGAFWSLVDSGDEGECWNWRGERDRKGYGRFFVGPGVRVIASRAAYMLMNGEIPAEMLVCHHCDNPPCCNPAHLYAGTHKQNAEDRSIRKRQTPRRGEKINEEIAMLIFAAEGTHNEIADAFAVSRSMVSMIKSGKRWPRIGTLTHA